VHVYAWAKDGDDPHITTIQDGFTLPTFPISDKVLADVGLVNGKAREGTTNHVMLYDSVMGLWTKIREGHVITIRPHQRVYLRAVNVTEAKGFQDILDRAQQSQEVPHFRNNLRNERASIRAQRNASLAKSSKAAPDSPLAQQATVTRPRTNTHDSTSDTTPRPKRARTATDSRSVADDEDILDLTMVPDSPPPRRKSFSTPKEVIIISSSESEDPNDDDDGRERRWPADFYAVEIQAGFAACEGAKKNRGEGLVAEAFETVFKVPFHKSTFYDHRARWRKASGAARSAAIAAGRTEAGRWRHFMNKNPSLGAAAKAHKRRVGRSETYEHSRQSRSPSIRRSPSRSRQSPSRSRRSPSYSRWSPSR